MTQKDKVKELVGRSLDSYHTKSLQQIDRIEKKNKEQNHKISILSNELDNDYLTKTEEGSVVSLEHSKDGMVYLDELQGNTLVNYCTDGSKEMTLNGDIDVEGVSVTTTEGIDNGKVDVMCEGNTLVNLVDKMWNNTQTYYTIDENYITILDSETDHRQGYYTLSGGQLNLIKPNTTYTIIAEITKNTLQRNFTLINNYQANGGDITSDNVSVPIGFVGRYVGKFTTLSDFTNRNRLGFSAGSGNRGEITLRNNFIILEGDWTNRDIPVSYFKGMKSVGQDDTNGHKIEILSSVGKENLIKDSDIYIEQSDTFKTFNSSYQNIIDKVQNKTITISVDIEVEDMIPRTDGKNRIGCELSVVYEDNTREYHGVWYTGENFKGRQARAFSITKKIKTIDYFGIYIQCAGKKHKIGRPKIEIGDTNTNWCPSSTDNLNGLQTFMNKKEILLNEPLRGFEDGKKDRLVKISGKWFIERNCILYDYSKYNWSIHNTEGDNYIRAFSSITEKLSSPITKCNTLISFNIKQAIGYNPQQNGVWVWNTENDQNYIYISLEKTKLSSLDSDGIKEWCRNNSLFVLCQLATPTYEPITDVELITYLDTTHISNNSLIPCNMKVKNSGYNVIIKPSTLYTIALDTNKSGTIGMNLGGVKGITANNVTTITTPATLADDSLRIYGKGIKGSKVRLIEGDKTNWIPSFFEGMKSCFEDKVQEDGSYGIEIVSNNENLFDINKRINKSSKYWWVIPKLKANKMSFKFNTSIPYIEFYESNIDNIYNIYTNWTVNSTFTNVSQGTTVAYKTDKPYVIMAFDLATAPSEEVMKSLQVVDGDKIPTDYTPQIINKIQFSSIEPLRGIGEIKDRFVFKDNKLMIERNIGQTVLNGSENWSMERHYHYTVIKDIKPLRVWIGEYQLSSDRFTEVGGSTVPRDLNIIVAGSNKNVILSPKQGVLHNNTTQEMKEWLSVNPTKILYQLETPTYEEIPYELQKIILEGYENGTLFFDTNIPPTSTVTYAGETPIVKATKLNKTEVLNNTNDINDNIIPYLMDMDYRVVCLELATETQGISMARLFGGVYKMLKRDILSRRYSVEEYKHRLDAYLGANKITEDEYNKLGDMLNE